jgi:hypothetical protein
VKKRFLGAVLAASLVGAIGVGGAASADQAPTITLDNLDPTWTVKVAVAKVQEKLAASAPTKLAPKLIVSPTVPSKEKALESKLLVPAMRLFQDYYQPKLFQVVMFTNKDGKWADSAFKKYGGDYPIKLSTQIKQWTSMNYCNFAFATRSSSGVPIYYECTDTRSFRNWTNYQNPAHEYFHLVQDGLTMARPPLWLIEGSASFFGEALGFASFSDPVQRKIQMNLNTTNDFDPNNEGHSPSRFITWARDSNVAEVKRVFHLLENSHWEGNEVNTLASYSLGSIATEALVATFGFDGFMKLWSALKPNTTFEAAFTETFGLTPDSFYGKLAPYLNKRI